MQQERWKQVYCFLQNNLTSYYYLHVFNYISANVIENFFFKVKAAIQGEILVCPGRKQAPRTPPPHTWP